MRRQQIGKEIKRGGKAREKKRSKKRYREPKYKKRFRKSKYKRETERGGQIAETDRKRDRKREGGWRGRGGEQEDQQHTEEVHSVGTLAVGTCRPWSGKPCGSRHSRSVCCTSGGQAHSRPAGDTTDTHRGIEFINMKKKTICRIQWKNPIY